MEGEMEGLGKKKLTQQNKLRQITTQPVNSMKK